MIKVAGSAFDMAAYTQAYKPDAFGVMMLEKMMAGGETFDYRSMDQLKFELDMRSNLVKAAKDLNSSGFVFKVFRKSKCNPDFWERTENGGFELRKDVKPSDAIRDIYINGNKYGTECATAIVIVYYKALVDTLPEGLFNSMFRKIYLMDWQHIDPNIGIEDYHDNPTYLPGDCRYFKNPDVSPLTPEWQGENVIDLGNGLYWGHGIGMAKSEFIIRALNSRRRFGSDTSAYLMDFTRRPDFRRLSDKVKEYNLIPT
jgi:protein-glutamine gamma-glutamyltransferase